MKYLFIRPSCDCKIDLIFSLIWCWDWSYCYHQCSPQSLQYIYFYFHFQINIKKWKSLATFFRFWYLDILCPDINISNWGEKQNLIALMILFWRGSLAKSWAVLRPWLFCSVVQCTPTFLLTSRMSYPSLSIKCLTRMLAL